MEDAAAAAAPPPSKKAEAKAKAKAEAKAKKEAHKAQRAAELAAAAAKLDLEEDPAQENYGNKLTTAPVFSQDAEEVEIRALNDSHEGKTVVVRAWLQNSRPQSAKMGFVELRKGGNWNIQGIAMASDQEPIVSKRMIKWITNINPESYIVVEAQVKKPLQPVKSCRVSGLELHITKCYVLAPAPAVLGMTMEAASQPIVNFSDESAPAAAEADAAKPATESRVPAASMLTHLDNIAMHKRAPIQQAIAVRMVLSMDVGVDTKFTWYRISALKSRGSSARTSKPVSSRNSNPPASSAQRLRVAPTSSDSSTLAKRPSWPNRPSSTSSSRLQEAGSACSASVLFSELRTPTPRDT
jgi:hypothetical protein